MKSKVLLLTHFYYPEIGAASVRVQNLAAVLVEANYELKVIAPIPNYPQGKIYPGFEKLFYKDEKTNTIYLPILFTKNKNVIGRLFSYLSYFLSSLFYGIFNRYKPDIVISSSPPIFTSLVGLIIAKIRRAKFILDIRDIWPDIGVQLGIINSKIGLFTLKKIEKLLLRNSDKVIVTTEGDKKNIINKGVSSSKIVIIYNGADSNIFKPIGSENETKVREKWNLPTDKKVFTYFGSFNLGMNDINILGEVLKEIQTGKEKFHFVSLGEGNLKNDFLNKIQDINFSEYPSLSLEEVAEIVSLTDFVVIPRKEIKTDTGGNVPVKCYESLAAGVPFILSVNKNDESYKIFSNKEFAFLIPVNDKIKLTESILSLINRTDLRELGLKGREFITQNFDRKKQSQKLVKIIEQLEEK